MSSPIYIFAATNYVTVFLVTHTHSSIAVLQVLLYPLHANGHKCTC